MAQLPKNQAPQKQTAEYAKARLGELVRSGGRYGVPVIVLRPDDAGLGPERHPERYSVHGRTGRAYIKKLDRVEREFIENKLDMLMPAGNIPGASRSQISSWVEKSWQQVMALGGAYAIALPHNFKTADQQGPDAYQEKSVAFVLLSHSDTDKKDWLSLFLKDPDRVDAARIPGTGAHWNTWVLEHEMAHSAGAGEAQADMMAAVQYIKTFGDDSLPRTIADIRAVNAILRHASEEYSQTYGWAPVAGVDALLAKGAEQIKSMTAGQIHALRFEQPETLRDDVDNFAGALARAGSYALPFENFDTLIEQTQAVLQSDVLQNHPGAQEVGKRFLSALNRLTGTTPAPAAVIRQAPKLSFKA